MTTYRIQRVSKLTGLSRDVIRVWERRYGLLNPIRGANKYRLYTDEDVTLLTYLRQELEKGSSIGELAALGRDELLARIPKLSEPGPDKAERFSPAVEGLIQSLDPLDRAVFEQRINDALGVMPFEDALQGILLPLQKRVGELWHDGRIGIAVEHYVTKQVQQKLFSVMNQLPVADHGSRIIVACPPGEDHEIGAQAVAYRCRVQGCRVYYLGANVPVTALARLCAQIHPALTLLSCASPLEAGLIQQISKEILPFSKVAAGGTGTLAMRDLLEQHRIEVLEDFPSLDERLRVLNR